MYRRNGSSELAKLMFKNSGNDDKLKQLLTDNYSETDLITYLHSEDPLQGTCGRICASVNRHARGNSRTW